MRFHYLRNIKLFAELTDNFGITTLSFSAHHHIIHLRILRRRYRIIRNLPLIPILNHASRRHNLIGDAPLQHPSLRPGDHCQKRHDALGPAGKCRHVVRHHQTLHGAPFQQLLYGRYGILHGIGIDAIAQYGPRAGFGIVVVEHHPGGVDEPNVLVQHHLLEGGGESRAGTDAHGAESFEAVEDGGFPDVGIPDDADGDARLGLLFGLGLARGAGVVFEELEEPVDAHGHGGGEGVFRFGSSDAAGLAGFVGAGLGGAGLESDGGMTPSEVREPFSDVAFGD
mmetsp:Transcript_9527/g.20601  ORF Transcript_9527/g.20601 Transcript_9527/m.20601 type:complete len:282 (+) Transcript_9527:315-1160(+)